jgi:hypothetical protein
LNLLTQAQFFNQSSVFEDVFLHQVVQQASTLTNQLNQRQFRALVFAEFLQVCTDEINSFSEHGNLCFGAACIGCRAPKVLKISFFLSAVNCMAISNGRQRYKTKMSKCGYSCEKV